MSFPNLSSLAVREGTLTLFFLLLSVAAGAYAFVSLGRAEDPSFTVRAMMVSAEWPGATPAEIEGQIVDSLEKRIQEVDYLDHIESSIRPGRADLLVVFADNTPSERVPDLFYQVRKRMNEAARQMPAGAVGPLVNDDFGDVYFSLIAVTAPGLPMRDLTREAEAIRDRLQQVVGVRRAQLLGERQERIFIEFDNDRLANLGISPAAIFAEIQAHNRLQPTGQLETEGARVYLRLDADLADPRQVARVPVRIGDSQMYLGDLATIRRGYEDPPSWLVRTGGEEAMILGIVMRAGENGLDLGARLATFLQAEQERLPLGMALTPITNQANAIAAAVNLFQIKFLVAVVVVMTVSILAIGLRAGLVVGIAIPVTLGLTFLVMWLMAINLDRITLGALIIALGLLVDDAIIAIEMMIVKMEEGWDRIRAASHAWRVTAAPMLFGTLITVAGFVPVGFARSNVGEYAGNIFWVLAIALLVSWLAAVTFIPYLGVRLLPAPRHTHDQQSLYDTPVYRRLRAVIAWCVGHRKTVVAATVALLMLAILGMAGPVEKQFFPTSDRTELMVSVFMPQGTAIANTDRTAARLEAALQKIPEVKSVSTSVGAGLPRFFASYNPEEPDPAFAKLLVMARNSAARGVIVEAVETLVRNGAFPEARIRIEGLFDGPPVRWPVSFRVVGPDPTVLRQIGRQVREVMHANPHTDVVHLEWDERVPVLNLAFAPDRLRAMGLTPAEVGRQLQFRLDGVEVTRVREGIRSVQVRARMAGERDRLVGLEIRTPAGDKVPLAQLGRLEVVFEDPVVDRYNRERFLAVSADIRNAQPNDVSAALWRALEPVRAALPQGYRLDIGGIVEESSKADAAIQRLLPVTGLLMLVFTMVQMRSFSGTLIVLATAPLGLIGAVLAMLVFQKPFGFVAMLGLIGLAGILMRNTLILAQQVSDNLNEGLDPLAAVVEAAVQRARPVVLTALAAILAFVPLTFDTFWGPMAYVLIGGVAVGTAITLLFVPALYALGFRLRPA